MTSVYLINVTKIRVVMPVSRRPITALSMQVTNNHSVYSVEFHKENISKCCNIKFLEWLNDVVDFIIV